jgi:hypothetical protein
MNAPYSSLTRTKLDDSIRALLEATENKLGKVIRLLGDGEYTSIDFSTLRGEDGRT